MDMPVVAAARLKGDVSGKQPALGVGQRVQKGIPHKKLGIGGVGGAGAKHVVLFKSLFLCVFHNKNLLEI